MVFLYPFSGSMRAYNGKEGDRMEHRDDVLIDDSIVYASTIK